MTRYKIALVYAFAALLTACGGGSGGDGAPTADFSKYFIPAESRASLFEGYLNDVEQGPLALQPFTRNWFITDSSISAVDDGGDTFSAEVTESRLIFINQTELVTLDFPRFVNIGRQNSGTITDIAGTGQARFYVFGPFDEFTSSVAAGMGTRIDDDVLMFIEKVSDFGPTDTVFLINYARGLGEVSSFEFEGCPDDIIISSETDFTSECSGDNYGLILVEPQ